MPSTQRDAMQCIECIPNRTLRGQVGGTFANATCGQGSTQERLDQNARAMWFSYPPGGLHTPFQAKCWLCRQQRQCIPVDSPEGTVNIGTECVEKTLRKRDLFRAIRTGRVSEIREANDTLATFVVRQSMQATVNSLETTLEQQKKRKRSLEEQLNQLTRDIQRNENVLHEMTSYLSRNDGGERSAKRPRITIPTDATAQQMRHTL